MPVMAVGAAMTEVTGEFGVTAATGECLFIKYWDEDDVHKLTSRFHG